MLLNCSAELEYPLLKTTLTSYLLKNISLKILIFPNKALILFKPLTCFGFV